MGEGFCLGFREILGNFFIYFIRIVRDRSYFFVFFYGDIMIFIYCYVLYFESNRNDEVFVLGNLSCIYVRIK